MSNTKKIASLCLFYLMFSQVGFAGVQGEEGAERDSVLIYLQAGGIHSDVVLPMQLDAWDWNDLIQKPPHLLADERYEWISFGWGSRLFYLNTPSWAKVKLKHLVGGMIGIGGAAYHIATKTEPQPSKNCKAMKLSAQEYQSLCHYLVSFFKASEVPRPLLAYKTTKEWDAFYDAKGYYFLFYNCNSWTNAVLRSCGRSKRKWVGTYKQLFKAI